MTEQKSPLEVYNEKLEMFMAQRAKIKDSGVRELVRVPSTAVPETSKEALEALDKQIDEDMKSLGRAYKTFQVEKGDRKATEVKPASSNAEQGAPTNKQSEAAKEEPTTMRVHPVMIVIAIIVTGVIVSFIAWIIQNGGTSTGASSPQNNESKDTHSFKLPDPFQGTRFESNPIKDSGSKQRESTPMKVQPVDLQPKKERPADTNVIQQQISPEKKGEEQ